MPETARLDKLEDSLRKTQDSMLLMSKDVHQMNMSINSIAKSIEVLVHIQQDLRVIDERLVELVKLNGYVKCFKS
jgi:hypothetical protein